MNLEARPWPVDFQAATASRQFSIFWGDEVWDLCLWDVVVFREFWSGFGAVLTKQT